MEGQSLIGFLFVGAVAGWIAGKSMQGGGFGLLGNIVVGVIGAVIGGFIFDAAGVAASGLIESLIIAVIGAAALLFVVGLFKN